MRGEWLDAMPAATQPSRTLERRAAVARDDAAIVEGGLDDAVQPRRAVEHARQIHHLVDAGHLVGPLLEGEHGLRVADVAAGRFHRARRRRRRHARIDLLRKTARRLDEILDAGQPARGVGDLVRALEVGGQALRQGDRRVLARAQPAALAVIVRVDEARAPASALALILRSRVPTCRLTSPIGGDSSPAIATPHPGSSSPVTVLSSVPSTMTSRPAPARAPPASAAAGPSSVRCAAAGKT